MAIPENQELLMPSPSRYAGEPVDTSCRRTIAARGIDAGGRLPSDAKQVIIDFFYHDGEFWTAVFDLTGLKSITGQAFNFSPPRTRTGKNGREVIRDRYGIPKRKIPILNHVQARFDMNPEQPILLFPLGCGEFAEATPAHEIAGFVYSVEVAGPAGVRFNFRDALFGNLLCAHRFLSVEEMVFERIVVQNQIVTETPPLALSADQQRSLLVHSVERAHRAGMSERYFMFRLCATKNCASNPLQILDTVVDYNLLHRMGSLLYRLPLSPRFYLQIRGLDSDPSFRKMVRAEFQNFIDDDRVQKRKRKFVKEQIRIRRAAQGPRQPNSGKS